jgi:AcrR family transcriptional regulator
MALDQFSQNGYDGTNIRALTESLGLVKSAMYRHFESKEAIWNALLDELVAYYETRFGSAEHLPPVPDTLDGRSLHTITRSIQNAVLEKFHVFLTVGFYAVATDRQEDFEKINAVAAKQPGVLGTHGVYFDDEAKTLSFDVLVDFTVRDKAGLCEAIRKELQTLFPGYTIMINLDTNYSD